MFDLRKLDTIAAAENGFTFKLVDIDDIETDVEISVIGVGSRTYRTAMSKIDRERNMAEKRGKTLSTEDSDELWIELIAKCTSGWKNLHLDGKDVPFSQEKAQEIYKDFPFVRNQVLGKIHDIKAQLGNLNKTSSNLQD